MADHDKEVDQATGTETTGHEWDGIKELNTPLPKWWLYTFYGCVIWALGYTVFFPAWPIGETATAGILGYSSRAELDQSLEAAEAAQSTYTDKIASMELADIQSDAELNQFSLAGGAAIFRNNCSQCHGSGAAGVQASGYPNLRDDAWLWGGTLEDIHYTVMHGIRNEQDPDARYSEMPAFGELEILTPEQIDTVADYVRSLSGLAEGSEEGATLFAENCAACHGDNGEGMHAMGAPNLSDQVWLYGSDKDTVVYTITHSRYGVMPAWGLRLSDADVKQVALYVHSLGGGQ